MTARETRKSLEELQEDIDYLEAPGRVDQDRERANSSTAWHEGGNPWAAFDWYKNDLRVILHRYGRGDAVADLVEQYAVAVDTFAEANAIARRSTPPRTEALVDEYRDIEHPRSYLRVVTLASLGITLGATATQFSTIADAIGNENWGRDRFLDTLLATRLSDHPVGAEPLKPRDHGRLLRAFDDPAAAPRLVRDYSKGWLGSMNRFGRSIGGFPRVDTLAYEGYWAWEVAATVLILDLDDSLVRDNEFYPVDAVDFARNAR